MKILRKSDEFKKMSDSSMNDILKIDNLIEQGWKYCSKKDYKDFFRVQKIEKVEESDKKTKSGKKAKKMELQ